MPGLKLQLDDPIVDDSDEDQPAVSESEPESESGDDDDSENPDDDKENGSQEKTVEEQFAADVTTIKNETADIKKMVREIWLMLQALLKERGIGVEEILAQSHEPGTTPAPTTDGPVDAATTMNTVASQPDSTSSSSARPLAMAAAPPGSSALAAAITVYSRVTVFGDSTPTSLAPALTTAVALPIEAGDTPMPDAAA